jgi:hypothetical protein
MSSHIPLNLVCRRQTLDAILEGYFIKEVLLAEIGRPIRWIAVEPKQSVPILNDSLVISFGTEFADYLKEARARGANNIGLLHMADEQGDQDRMFYGDADYVMRHYWFKDAMNPPSPESLGVIWIPNGYRTGVGPISVQTMLPTAERKIIGFFAGDFQARMSSAAGVKERRYMASIIKEANIPFAITETPGFSKGYGPVSFAAHLSMSRFGLVPGGNSPETIRLYEVLEAGAIPIMLRSPFVTAPEALDNPPFLLLNDWAELPKLYARYADAENPQTIAEIEALRQTIVKWWKDFKIRNQSRVRDLINLSFARTGRGN